jgi:hypothetical protein
MYSGNICRGAATFTELWGVMNATTTPVFVLCPLIRLQDGTPWKSLTLTMFDRNGNPNQDISCDIWTSNADGSAGVVNATAHSVSSSLFPMNSVVTSSVSGASTTAQVVLECSIPGTTAYGASHITSISLTD